MQQPTVVGNQRKLKERGRGFILCPTVNHRDTCQSGASVSLCMWKWTDTAFVLSVLHRSSKTLVASSRHMIVESWLMEGKLAGDQLWEE